MSSFAKLMALSASQTRESSAAVQSALAERQKKEALKRKQQEEKEAKEREMEKKLLIKRLEEQQREQERQQRLEEERRRKDAERKRKEDEQRDALLYGPKRAKSEYPSSSAGARNEARRNRPATSDDEGGAGGGAALTREEKRQQRLQRELNYGLSSSKRSVGGSYRKAGRRLPGGAVDTTTTNGASASHAYRSVRERFAAEPPALIKLNVNKRDTRTIDEILQDRAKQKAAKTLSGEDAKGFDNWFGKAKPKAETAKADAGRAVSRASSMFSSRSNSPERRPSAEAPMRPTKSLSSTPPAMSKPAGSSKPHPGAANLSASVSRLVVSSTPAPKGTGVQITAFAKPLDKSFAANGSSSRPAFTKKSSTLPDKAPSKSSASASGAKQASSAPRKRQRSPSLSDSPPPPKRRPQAQSSISAEIWKMFGKDRNRYVSRDVFSDDDDMEADALEVEHEELYSAKLARKEDEEAAEEERRHEEEKRRKRKERERRG